MHTATVAKTATSTRDRQAEHHHAGSEGAILAPPVTSFSIPAPIQPMMDAGGNPPFSSTAAATASSSNHTGLPDQMKENFEAMGGFDLSDVRVHYSSREPEKIGALAYAQGNQIYLGPGQQKHLGHEAWHVVQQKQGRVRPTIEMQGKAVNNDMNLENEANLMKNRALQSRENSVSTALQTESATSSNIIQGKFASGLNITSVDHLTSQYKNEMNGLTFKEKRTVFQELNSAETVYEAAQISKAILDAKAKIKSASQSASSSPDSKPETKPKPVFNPNFKTKLKSAANANLKPETASSVKSQSNSGSDQLAKYTRTTAHIIAYRADDRAPGEIRRTNGFLQKEHKSLNDVMGLLRQYGTRAFAQDHVSNNRGYLVSLAVDQECGGYASSRYVYKFDFGRMNVFTPPKARSKLLEQPIFYTNADSLDSSTLIAMDPRKDTEELDFFSGIPLSYVISCRGPRGGPFHPLEWGEITPISKAERPNISDITIQWTPS